MKKTICPAIIISFIASLCLVGQNVIAQAIREKIVAAKNNPKAKENAAKADVYIVKQNHKKNKSNGIAENNDDTDKRKHKKSSYVAQPSRL